MKTDTSPCSNKHIHPHPHTHLRSVEYQSYSNVLLFLWWNQCCPSSCPILTFCWLASSMYIGGSLANFGKTANRVLTERRSDRFLNTLRHTGSTWSWRCGRVGPGTALTKTSLGRRYILISLYAYRSVRFNTLLVSYSCLLFRLFLFSNHTTPH